MKKNKLKVIELFAGVGGFRIGLDRATEKEEKNTDFHFETIWSNQWEPSTQRQHASEVYVERFGESGHSNKDIASVELKEIPVHDLLVGGFPCQDYSVARTLSQSAGLHGKKGVLWWEIYRILDGKKPSPDFIFLENVDRLLKSPASARGRDFSIMLASLAKLNYVVEWRVVNASEYGKPQRRRRTFILGYKKGTTIEKELRSHKKNPVEWMINSGVVANALKVEEGVESFSEYNIGKDPTLISEKFSEIFPNDIDFQNTGVMIDGIVYTGKTKAKYKGKTITLGQVLEMEKDVPDEYFVSDKDLKIWKYLKGAKKEARKSKTGFEYMYAEGSMTFPDHLDKPSRTIITAEGGATASRFKHIIKTESGKHRRLMPIELERLCQFPDNHTKLDGISDVKRAFFMGNALVVGIVEDIGRSLLRKLSV